MWFMCLPCICVVSLGRADSTSRGESKSGHDTHETSHHHDESSSKIRETPCHPGRILTSMFDIGGIIWVPEYPFNSILILGGVNYPTAKIGYSRTINYATAPKLSHTSFPHLGSLIVVHGAFPRKLSSHLSIPQDV